MVTMNTRGSILMLLCAAALAGCSKIDINSISEAPQGGARIMFANFAVNAPSVNFYDGTGKVTAVGPASGKESATGTAYGRFAAAAYYVDITPGQHTLAGKISPTAATDAGVAISTASMNLDVGKFYTYYQSGIYNATAKTADGFVTEDPIPATFDWANANVRFVNASGNSQPMTLYAKDQVTLAEVPIGAAVAYKSAGAYTPIPATTYNLAARVTGSSTNAISRTSVAFSAGRYYTITAYGDMTVTGTTAANRPQLDNTANR